MLPTEVIEKIIAYLKTKNKEVDKSWLAKKIGLNAKTFIGKLNRKSLAAMELIKIAVILNLDLNKFKEICDVDDIDTLNYILPEPVFKNVDYLVDITNPNMAIIGNIGSAKTTLLKNIALSCLNRGEKILVISMFRKSVFTDFIESINADLIVYKSDSSIGGLLLDNRATVIELDQVKTSDRVEIVESIIKKAGCNAVSRVFISEGAEYVADLLDMPQMIQKIPLVIEMQNDFTLFDSDPKMSKFKKLFNKIVLLPIYDIRFYEAFQRGYFLDNEHKNRLLYGNVGIGVIVDSEHNSLFKLPFQEECL